MIVGLGHVAQTGKDTAAQALCRDLGFRRIGFADKLKDLAFEADPMILANQMTNVGVGSGHLRKLVASVGGWDQAKTRFPEVRRFLQNLGAGGRAVFGEDFWIEQALKGVDPSDNVVIADVRYPNEFDLVKSLGGRMVKVTRPGHDPYGHPSETSLTGFEFDAVIDNHGSLVELETQIVELVRGWLTPKPIPPDAKPDVWVDPVNWNVADFVKGVGHEERMEH